MLLRIKAENQYVQKFIFEYFKCFFDHLDEDFISKTIKDEEFKIKKIYEKLKNEKDHFKVEKKEESDDDIFSFSSFEFENTETEEKPTEIDSKNEEDLVYEFPSSIQTEPISLDDFLKIEDVDESFKIFTSSIKTEMNLEICLQAEIFFKQILRHHETAIQKDIQIVEIFIKKLLNFILKKKKYLKIFRETMFFCFDDLLELCFSYSDLLRLKSTELLFSLIEPENFEKNYEKAKDTSVMYHQLTNEKNWYSELKEYTFELQREKMTKKEAEMLFRLNKIQIFSVGKLTNEENETLKNFKEKIDKNLKFYGKGFVKLSSRSPKDSGFVSEKYSKFVEEMKNDWIKKFNLKIDSNNEIPKSIQNSIEQICCVKCLQIESSNCCRSTVTFFNLIIFFIIMFCFLLFFLIMFFLDSKISSPIFNSPANICPIFVSKTW